MKNNKNRGAVHKHTSGLVSQGRGAVQQSSRPSARIVNNNENTMAPLKSNENFEEWASDNNDGTGAYQ
jgi:hypothetical protein